MDWGRQSNGVQDVHRRCRGVNINRSHYTGTRYIVHSFMVISVNACDGLNGVSPKFICRSPNPQSLRV